MRAPDSGFKHPENGVKQNRQQCAHTDQSDMYGKRALCQSNVKEFSPGGNMQALGVKIETYRLFIKQDIGKFAVAYNSIIVQHSNGALYILYIKLMGQTCKYRPIFTSPDILGI